MAEQRTPPQRPSSTRAWAVYTLLRLLFFAVPLLLVWLFSDNLAVAAVVAAVIGLCLSVILLDRQRGAVATRIEGWAEQRRPSSDESFEDRAIDGGDDERDPRSGDGQSSDSAPARPRP